MRGRPKNGSAPGRIMWSTVEIAEAMGWRVERVRRWLNRDQALTKHGRYYYANKRSVLRAFGEAGYEIIAKLPE